MNTIWKGVVSIIQGVVAVVIVSTAVTFLMFVSTWFQSVWAWRLATFFTVFGMGVTHFIAIFLHRHSLCERFDFIGMLLVPLTAPFVAVSALQSVLLCSYGRALSRPDEYSLMFLWFLGVCVLGIPIVWRIVWLYTTTSSDGRGGIFPKPNEPRYRSTSLPPK